MRRRKLAAFRTGSLKKLSKAVRTILEGVIDASIASSQLVLKSKPVLRAKAKTKLGTKGLLQKRGKALLKSKSESHGTRSAPVTKNFTEHRFTATGGTREYKLYRPQKAVGKPSPLVIMLHGCLQSPDDFAAGTGMNQLANKLGFLVGYPAQSKSANASKCWNWFNPADQRRGMGEPSIIAGITSEIIQNQNIDRSRVYIAGLSAGGAAAAILLETYPDIYAAAGVHSGVACGLATSMVSAFTVMKKGGTPKPRGKTKTVTRPMIIFQGDDDNTVHPSNAEALIDRRGVDDDLRVRQSTGDAGGLNYTKTVYKTLAGKSVLENWRVHRGGHAWFGGSPAGSYATSQGPDASAEMIRFFLQHSL